MDLILKVNRYIIGTVKTYLNKLSSKLNKIKKLPQLLLQKSHDVLKAIVDFLIKKPQSLDDYVKFPYSYVAKRFIGRLIVVLAALILIILFFAVPLIKSMFFKQSLIINTTQYHTASGKVEVYHPGGKELLYTGDMENGKSNGEGKVYQNGILVYQGGFKDNEYSGYGDLFYPNGNKAYSGFFENSLYNGEGTLYYPNGNPKAQGTFVDNKLNGKGILYDEDNAFRKIYEGDFSDDAKQGMGSEFDPDTGELVYTGEFADGSPGGKGKKYQDGKPVYKGDFIDGEYAGNGELYEDSKLVYKGGFENGEFSGIGELMDENGNLKYKGGFENGEFSGTGELMDEDGNLKYKGEFKNGEFDGNGELYSNNKMVYSGQFKGGEGTGQGTVYNDAGMPLFSGNLADSQIDYYRFIGADKGMVTGAFLCAVTEKEIDGALLLYYSDLKVGFLFKDAQIVDRIIFTGTQVLYDTKIDIAVNELPAELTDGIYSKYSFTPTAFESKLMEYMNIRLSDSLYTEKYINENVFVKIYSEQDKTILFYEIGLV